MVRMDETKTPPGPGPGPLSSERHGCVISTISTVETSQGVAGAALALLLPLALGLAAADLALAFALFSKSPNIIHYVCSLYKPLTYTGAALRGELTVPIVLIGPL